VQGVNRPFPLSGDEARQFAQGVGNGLFQQRPFRLGGATQHIIQHLAAVAGMPMPSRKRRKSLPPNWAMRSRRPL